MSEATEVQAHQSDEDLTGQGDDVIVYRMRGAYFFGAAALLGSVLNRIADNPKAFVLDFSEVPLIDSSGARSVALLGRKLARNGGHLYLTGTSSAVRRVLLSQEVHEPDVSYLPDVAEALAVVRQAKGSVGVTHPRKVQALRRADRAAGRAVARLKRLVHAIRRPCPAAHPLQRADDGADLIVQEAAGAQVEADLGAAGIGMLLDRRSRPASSPG